MNKAQDKIYIIGSIFIIMAIILFGFLIYFIWGGIRGASNEIISDKKEVMFIQGEDQELENFKMTYALRKPDLEKMSRLFVDARDPINFITFLESVSADSNVATDISIAPASFKGATENNNAITFQIYAYGNFSNIIKFSEKLEAGPYLVSVSNVTVKKLPKDTASKTKSSEGDIEAYLIVEALPK